MANLDKNETTGIKVVGVGGAGANALSYLYAKWQQVDVCNKIDFIVMNNDEASLKINPCPHKVLLGLDGHYEGQPYLGALAVEQNEAAIAEVFQDAKIVVVVAGMGGNTATSAAPLIARIAKEQGCFVAAMAITPFAFEGEKRLAKAEEGLGKLREAADRLSEFSNDELLKAAAKNTTMEEAFRLVYDVIFDEIRKIAKTAPHVNLSNLEERQ